MAHASSGIPFPQGEDEKPLFARREYRGNYTIVKPSGEGQSSLHPYPGETSNALQTHQSHRSSSSMHQGESLPSIRNLFHSIEDDATSNNNSLNMMRRSPSASNLPAANIPPPSDHLPALSSFGGTRSISMSQPANLPPWNINERPELASASTSSIWETQIPTRSMSPQRRPPIAPSAYAHSQYNQEISRSQTPSQGPPGSTLQYRPGSAPSRGGIRGNLPLNLQSDPYKKQKSLHSPSSSIPSINSEDLIESHLPLLGAWNRQHQYEGRQDDVPIKREIHNQQETKGAATVSASSRRRHTVGALEEPLHFNTNIILGQEVKRRQRKITDDGTPRHHQSHLRAQVLMRPDSPTTPTALGHGTQRLQQQQQHYPVVENAGMPQLPSHHRIYLQHADHGTTGSLPSLSSSVSTVSLSSNRARVQSLEESRERRGFPVGWSPPTDGHYISKATMMEPMSSPRSTIWHSRSSTIDSLDSNTSSFASVQSPFNRPRPPQRTSSLHAEEGGNSVTWSGTSSSRRAARQMNTPYSMPNERLRHDSIRSAESESRRSLSIREEFEQEEGNHHGRPRARTMTYPDRPIAPLPAHSQMSHLGNSNVMVGPSRSGRSIVLHHGYPGGGVANLPQKVSSMEINPDVGQMRHQVYERHLPSSSNSSLGSIASSGLVGKHGSSSSSSINSVVVPTTYMTNVSSSSGAKYECGWCGKRFSRPSSLKIHHHSHTGEKPFACPAPNCGRTFSVQSNLRRHQKCHSTPTTNARLPGKEEGPVGLEKMEESKQFVKQEISSIPSTSDNIIRRRIYESSFSQSCPSDLATVGQQYNQAATVDGPVRLTGRQGKANSFLQSRERRISSFSSNAEKDDDDDDEEEEDVDVDEDEEGESRGFKGNDSLRTSFDGGDDENNNNDDDLNMQDIEEEETVVQHQQQRSALQGILNSQTNS